MLFVGKIPESDEFTARGLSLRSASDAQDVAHSDVRAVVVVVSDFEKIESRQLLRKHLQHYALEAALQGALVILAVPKDNIASALESAKQYAPMLAQWEKSFGVSIRQLEVMAGDKWASIAELSARYDCGSSQNAGLKIHSAGSAPLNLDPEVEGLLRRAFHDFESIRLQAETGGKSKVDGVWKVEAEGDEKASPFIVKCGPAPAIEVHINTYADVVADRVPYRGCTPVCLDRCVRGATRRLIVSRFIENAERLDEAVLNRDVQPAVESIFSQVLDRWRRNPPWAKVQLWPEFLPKARRVSYKRGLSRTYSKLIARGEAPLDPKLIFKTLALLPVEARPYPRAHDDLNIRNVFVSGQPGEPVLIDFTRSAKRPMSHDVSRLDVGLGFDSILHDAQPLPESVLMSIYGGDLFQLSLEHVTHGKVAKHRLDAIFALRRGILEDGARVKYDLREEYAVAICVGLLYYAKSAGGLGLVAYRCASALTAKLVSSK